MPKSITCAVSPGSRSITLSGLMSRWTMPRNSASSSERATCAAMSQRPRRRHRPGAQRLAHGLALDEAHDEEVPSLVDAGVEQGDGVGRAQQRGDVRLADEAVAEGLVRRQVGVEQLDRDARPRCGCRWPRRPRPCRRCRAGRQARSWRSCPAGRGEASGQPSEIRIARRRTSPHAMCAESTRSLMTYAEPQTLSRGCGRGPAPFPPRSRT